MTSLLITKCCCDTGPPPPECPSSAECDEVDCGYLEVQLVVTASGTLVTNKGTYTWTMTPQDGGGIAVMRRNTLQGSRCIYRSTPTFPGQWTVALAGDGPSDGYSETFSQGEFENVYGCFGDGDGLLTVRPRRVFEAQLAVQFSAPYVVCPVGVYEPITFGGTFDFSAGSIADPEFDISSTVDAATLELL
jgi:hypothetical protein